jgi:predicted lipoprotein with Yx(FWY)xxD motif
MMRKLAVLIASMAGGLVLPASLAHAGPYQAPYDVQVHKMAKGDVLTDSKGMTLYTFSKDGKGVSNCTGACAELWPPLKADDDDKPVGDFTIVSRSSGGKQWAHDGMPLYTFKKDSKPGQMNGDGYGGVWHVAKPS